MTIEERNEIIQYHISKAYESLNEALFLAKGNFWNAVANRLYYACFNAVRAILVYDEIAAHTHSGLKNQFHKNYIKKDIFDAKLGEILNRIMNQRDDADYKVKLVFTKEQIEPSILETQKFVDIIVTKIKASL